MVAPGNFDTAFNFSGFGATLTSSQQRIQSFTAENDDNDLSSSDFSRLEVFVDEGGIVRDAVAEVAFYSFEDVEFGSVKTVMVIERENTNGLLIFEIEPADESATSYNLVTEPLSITEYRITERLDINAPISLIAPSDENTPPVAGDDEAVTDEDTPIYIPILDNDSDADGDELTVELGDPSNGSVVFDGEGYIYTPDADFNGNDRFTYAISDGNGGSDTATVTIAITAVDDAPVGRDGSDETSEDTSQVFDVQDLISEVDGDTTVVTASVPAEQGSVTVDGTFISFMPAPNFTGEAVITYTVTDQTDAARSATNTLTINVLAFNDAPVNTIGDLVGTEDTALKLTGLSVADVDSGEGTITVTLSVGAGTGVITGADGTGVTVTGSGSESVTLAGTVADINAYLADANSQPEFTPTENSNVDLNGLVTLTMLTDDGGNTGSGDALTDEDTATISITPVDDAPVAADGSDQTSEDTPQVFDVQDLISEFDGDTTVVTATVPADQGSVTVEDTFITFAPAPNFNGEAVITYTVTDQTDAARSATNTLTITVLAFNDAPVNTIGDLVGTEDTALKLTGLSVADVDAGAGTITVTLSVGAGTGVITGADGTGVTVTGSGSESVTLTGTVADINAYLADANSQPEFTPTENSNVDLDGLVTLTMFTNDGGNNGLGGALTDQDTATISITAVDDAPETADTADLTDEDIAFQIIDVQDQITEVDGDATVLTATVPAEQGSVTVDGTVIFYTPAPNFNGEAVITYTVTDQTGAALSDSSTVTVTVLAVPDAPVAVDDDGFSTAFGTAARRSIRPRFWAMTRMSMATC